ncbi:GNAT family N-acetyltransferase [Terasakiella sp. SH-1]|uniref:GNAT family N-acetyltransferase n=1 Tax=Terasakiella sp. SH-1 TaxID=2560057 RepID=UPI001074546D|nr:GNAT family N-acetyltransferase [Terasakiella sp. SH-1]
MKISPFEEKDWNAVWSLIEPVFRAGETYPYPRDISKDQTYQNWIIAPKATYVCVDDDGQILGTYYIKANQPGQGSHICNCGYIVSEQARGRGVASTMCTHSQKEGKRLGFHAMQFNLVVASNEGAYRLWTSLGFETMARLPDVFDHPTHGFVDAYVMYKKLT